MSKHTPGPWTAFYKAKYDEWHVSVPMEGATMKLGLFHGGIPTATICREYDARLIAAAPELLNEAQSLRCLATSPRFQRMTVADALAELKMNGCGHDDGAAIAKATGES